MWLFFITLFDRDKLLHVLVEYVHVCVQVCECV